MNQLPVDVSTVVRLVHHQLCRLVGAPVPPAADPAGRDRGAVSLEQVLWFVAAGVSVAVVAGILWSQIRQHASAPVSTPTAP